MNIKIDNREVSLFNACISKKTNYPNHEVCMDNLDIGDIIIDNIVIERKTWKDLEQSIKDGRYKEQGFRLEEAKEKGFIIFYLIEGLLSKYKGGLSKETLISSLFSLTQKGFFVVQSENVDQSALYIMQFLEKKNKSKKEKPKENYEQCSIQKKKNIKITQDNIGIYMLCQIPYINYITAEVIMKKYKNIQEFIEKIRDNPKELEDFTYSHKEKSKKLNKRVITNIKKFLLFIE